jgi:hypothetical protein
MEEPKLKKPKMKADHDDEEEEANRSEEEANSSSEEEQQEDPGSLLQKNDEGDSFLELSKTKRVTVRKYNNQVLVDIREVRKRGIEGDKKYDPAKISFAQLRFLFGSFTSFTRRTTRCFREKRASV